MIHVLRLLNIEIQVEASLSPSLSLKGRLHLRTCDICDKINF